MTWVRARTTGAALRRAGASRIRASQSSGVMVMTVPEPKLMPPLAAVPGSTSSTLAPMVAMLLRMAADGSRPDVHHGDHRTDPDHDPESRQERTHGVALERDQGRAQHAVELHAGAPFGSRGGDAETDSDKGSATGASSTIVPS